MHGNPSVRQYDCFNEPSAPLSPRQDNPRCKAPSDVRTVSIRYFVAVLKFISIEIIQCITVRSFC